MPDTPTYDDASEHKPESALFVRADEHGYTLAEVVIAMMITAVVLHACYAAYGFARQYVDRWRDDVALENAAHRTLRDVTRRLTYAESIHVPTEGPWSATQNGRSVTYTLRNGRLLRDDVPLHDDRVRVLHAAVMPADGTTPPCTPDDRLAPPSSSPSTTPAAETVQHRRPMRIRIRWAVPTDTLDTCTTVFPRNPFSWEEGRGQREEARLVQRHQ